MMLYLTGALDSLTKSPDNPQTDANKSLGGYVSSTPVPNGAMNVLFDLISQTTLAEKPKETIALGLINKFDKAVNNVTLKMVVGNEYDASFKVAAVMLNSKMAMESNASTPGYPDAAVLVDWLFTDLKTLNEKLFAERISPHTELLEKVQNNLRFAAANQLNLVIRIPVVSDLNDTPQEQQRLVDFCCELKTLRPDGELTVQLLRQHHLAEPKYKALSRPYPCENAEPPARETLAAFTEAFQKCGIKASFFG